MPIRRLSGFRRSQYSQANLLRSHGVITCNNLRAAVANEVAARVSDMRDHGTIGPQRAGNDRGRHARLRCRRAARFIDLQVSRLNRTGKQSLMRLTALGTREAVQYGFDRELRRHFTLLLSSDSVSQYEHTSMRAQLLGSIGQQIAEI